jgi:hypothetical protein
MKNPLPIKLTNLILAALLLSLAVAAVVLFFQKSYVTALVLLLGAALFFLSFRLSDYAKITIILLCLFIYLAAYLTNVLLIFMGPKLDDSYKQRQRLARQLGVPFDTRTPLQMLADLQARGVDAVPMLTPFDLVLTGKSLAGPGRRLLPLAGISRKTTVFCNECGAYAIYQADERGFNNPLGIWSQAPLDVVVTGDSYAHGACVPPGSDLASLLRQGGKKVLNLGYSANGPLLELAGLREYGPALKPKVVLWLYFEGNDLPDLAKEQKSSLLTRYLHNASYSQDLIHQQAVIDQGWNKHLEASLEKAGKKPWYHHFSMVRQFLRTFQLKKLKDTIREAVASLRENYSQNRVLSFKQVLAKSQSLVQSWGGTLYFVYLPAFDRYHGKDQAYPQNRRDAVIAMVQSLRIPLIDFHLTLKSLPDPLVMFPFKTNAHYTKAGYKLLAGQVSKALREPLPLSAAQARGARKRQ